MKDITNPRILYLKGALFVVLGTTASAILLLENLNIKAAILLAIAVWAFARAYFFAFYVVERYVDPGFRFAGLVDFARYVLRKKTP